MEILAFDYGEDIVGMIDLNTDAYTRYRGARLVEGAKRVLACEGIIVSFNGTDYDLPRLAKLARDSASHTPSARGIHHDMQVEASRDRWPPRPGTDPIVGTDLRDHYRHYCGRPPAEPPGWLECGYERNNWLDCYMTAELWRRIILPRDPTVRFVSGKRP